MRKCEFRLRIYLKKTDTTGYRFVTKWLTGYFHLFFQEGSINEETSVDCGMKIEDLKGHIHTIWNDKDVRMRDYFIPNGG